MQVVPNLSLASAELLLVRGAVAVQVDGMPAGVCMGYDARLRAPAAWHLTEPQVHSFLRAIACPALLIKPESGHAYAGSSLAARRPLVTELKLVPVPGGHHAHMETPQPVAAAIRAFLAAQDRPPTPERA